MSVPAYALQPANRLRNFVVTRADVAEIERFIRDCEGSKVQVQNGLDLLVRTLALIVKGHAQQRSAGPVAPGKRSVPALANRIPVQRITGRYFAGWQVRKMGHARFMIYNDSKEAYLIETGLYQRIRRPILKLSLIAMLKFLEASRTDQRFLPDLIGFRRDSRGRYASVPMGDRLMGTSTLGGMAGPRGADDRAAAYLP